MQKKQPVISLNNRQLSTVSSHFGRNAWSQQKPGIYWYCTFNMQNTLATASEKL